MYRTGCFEVASSSSQSLVVGVLPQTRQQGSLHLSVARPPAATSTFITCSASEMLMRNSSCAQTAKSMAVYLLLLLSKLALTPKSSQYLTHETHPSRAAASKEYPAFSSVADLFFGSRCTCGPQHDHPRFEGVVAGASGIHMNQALSTP